MKPKLIEDLGLLYPNELSKKKQRYGIYECPVCHKPYKTIHKSILSGASTKCRPCANVCPNKATKVSDSYRKPLGYSLRVCLSFILC